MYRLTALFLALVFTTVHALAATPTNVTQTKSQAVLGTPWALLLGLDPTNPSNVNALIVAPDGSITVGFSSGVSITQGDQGTNTSPWFMNLRDATGNELGIAAAPLAMRLFDGGGSPFGTTANPLFIQNLATDPASMRLSDGTVFYKGAEDRTLATAPFSVRFSDGTSFYDGAQDRTLATAPFAVRQTDGTTFFKAAEDRTTSGAPSSSQLSNGSAFYSAMDQATGEEIELNTDSPTVFTHGNVSVTTSATLIKAATPGRRSLLVRNSDSNTVVFLGGASVTTANGLDVATAGATGANGNGGTVVYTHTDAVYGIVSSGTADIRWQEEAD